MIGLFRLRHKASAVSQPLIDLPRRVADAITNLAHKKILVSRRLEDGIPFLVGCHVLLKGMFQVINFVIITEAKTFPVKVADFGVAMISLFYVQQDMPFPSYFGNMQGEKSNNIKPNRKRGKRPTHVGHLDVGRVPCKEL
ncbi:hypothetical protein VNO77_09038 [Canavalia gladiata]|uniref:Uncharacterized protein n=1 Tax=Canavalia gladiata TaxID=3824 RepID=A0AAN9R190_CANGL